jgi:hypothetical protein
MLFSKDVHHNNTAFDSEKTPALILRVVQGRRRSEFPERSLYKNRRPRVMLGFVPQSLCFCIPLFVRRQEVRVVVPLAAKGSWNAQDGNVLFFASTIQKCATTAGIKKQKLHDWRKRAASQ